MPSLHNVCERAGISYRQGDHWIRKGYIHVEDALIGSGLHRELTLGEAAQFVAVGQLIRAGFTLKAAMALLPGIVERGFTANDKLAVVVKKVETL
jgi:hypothetical protein